MNMFDEFGPELIIEVYNPKVGMHGFLIIDSSARGPGKGGIRMTPTLDKEEVFRLARTMTWKNALANLPFGGAKSGIIADPKLMSKKQKDSIIAEFSKALKIVCPEKYVAAPDINTAEHEMEVVAKANGSKKSCTGKPKKMGGIPHELGSTGFGVFHSALVAVSHLGWNLKEKTVAVEGFGNVGSFVAKFISESGAKLVAVSDSKGVIYNKGGINFKKLENIKRKTGSVTNYPGKKLTSEEIISLPVDILITAAVPDLIKVSNVHKVKAKLIVEGSNIPMKPEVEEILYKHGILVVPDFVANAGGVISSYVEYINGSVAQMFKLVEKKVTENTKMVLEISKKKRISPREAAMQIAKERVLKKCKICRV